MKVLHIVFSLLILPPAVGAAAGAPFRTARELDALILTTGDVGRRFLTTGVVQRVWSLPSYGGYRYLLEDHTGRFEFRKVGPQTLRPGDKIEVTCFKEEYLQLFRYFVAESHKVLGTAAVTPPVRLALTDLDEKEHDYLTIVTEGLVVDIVPDEIDANYSILLLKERDRILPVFVPRSLATSDLLDARIRFQGQYLRLANGERHFSGPMIDEVRDLEVTVPAAANRIDVPPIDPGDLRTPREIAEMNRRSMTGRVLATWGGRHLMLRAGSRVVNATLSRGIAPPKSGAVVKISGYPGTDLFRLHLAQALWRPEDAVLPAEPGPESLAPETFLLNRQHSPEIKSRSHGKLLRLTGLVRRLPDDASPERSFQLDTGNIQIPVDFSDTPAAIAALEPGCRIAVTGYCRLDSNVWQPYETFPQISGFALLPRQPADIEILSRPAWWTPVRLFAVIVVLLAVLLAILAWNRTLNRLVERRGRQLLRAEVDNARAALRVEERTHLAVELHDAISQNLTGVALEINIASRKASADLPRAMEHLNLAQMTLRSCREELRHCLWDLRNNALGAATMDEAIRQTLAPQIGETRLFVRFNVPRRTLSDNTAHVLLRVIRELAVNAVRHGHASRLRIAGTRDGDFVRFSVSDDGTGFDTARAAGIREGHFGLQGIRERIAALGGRFEIVSTPGSGTRAMVSIGTRPTAGKEEECPSAS